MISMLCVVLSIFLKLFMLFSTLLYFYEHDYFSYLHVLCNDGKFKLFVITYKRNRIYLRGFFANLNNSNFYFNVSISLFYFSLYV